MSEARTVPRAEGRVPRALPKAEDQTIPEMLRATHEWCPGAPTGWGDPPPTMLLCRECGFQVTAEPSSLCTNCGEYGAGECGDVMGSRHLRKRRPPGGEP